MENKLKLISDVFGREKFIIDELVANHTTLSIGGSARLFFVATSPRELVRIVTEARKLKIPFLILGSGSKIIISDNGFNGLVIKNRTKNIAVVGVKGRASIKGVGVEEALVEIDSGVSIASLIEFLEKQGLRSAEFLGIAGTLGGNLFINSNLQSKVKNIKVMNQEAEEEEINVRDLSLRKHIILSAVLNFKSKGG